MSVLDFFLGLMGIASDYIGHMFGTWLNFEPFMIVVSIILGVSFLALIIWIMRGK